MGRDKLQKMNLSNHETLGDILEVFFGLCYFMQHPANETRDRCRAQLKAWERLDAVVRYVYHHWESRDRFSW